MRLEVWKWIKLSNLALIDKKIKTFSPTRVIRRAFPLLLACAATLAAQDAPVAGTWKLVSSPNGGTQSSGNVFLATAALSSTDAWAVGAEPNPSQYLTAPLAEHWDGTQWTI